MKATSVIRQLLDIIDQLDHNQGGVQEPEPERVTQDDEHARFLSIVNMLKGEDEPGYDNAPEEVVSDYDAVTTDAGGGVNGPKHPDDIRVKDPRGYE